MDLEPLLADLRAEHDDLAQRLDGQDWQLPTPAEGWNIHDTVAHLQAFDGEAAKAAGDPDAFTRDLATTLGDDPLSFVERMTEQRRAVAQAELRQRWHDGFDALLAALRTADPAVRVPWYGPPMSLTSCATARLMEYWAHGQDCVDALGQQREPTARLKNIAHLGVRTRGFAFANAGQDVPTQDVRVELEAPDGSTWSWGSGDDTVTGPALDFCLLVTQRRARADLTLKAEGPTANAWLELAQCFAGPSGKGRG